MWQKKIKLCKRLTNMNKVKLHCFINATTNCRCILHCFLRVISFLNSFFSYHFFVLLFVFSHLFFLCFLFFNKFWKKIVWIYAQISKEEFFIRESKACTRKKNKCLNSEHLNIISLSKQTKQETCSLPVCCKWTFSEHWF